jgi:hypothetical protein
MTTMVPPAEPIVAHLLGLLCCRLQDEFPRLPPEIVTACVEDARPFVRRYAANPTAYAAAVEQTARVELDALAVLPGDSDDVQDPDSSSEGLAPRS